MARTLFALSSLKRVRLGPRLVFSMVGLVAFTAVTVSLLASRNLEAAMIPSALERLDTIVHRRATDFQTFADEVSLQVLADRKTAPVEGLVRAALSGGFDRKDNSTLEQWKARLAQNFKAMAEGRPLLYKLRLIGAAGGGREIVRVDRMTPNGSVRVVPESELQSKGDRDFFQKASSLKDGEVYFSQIDLNQEHGQVAVPHVPVFRVATPVKTPDGEPFGIIVANIDMRLYFDDLRTRAPVGVQTYFVDGAGHYLLHPNREKEFAATPGSATDWRKDFPEVAQVAGNGKVLQREGQGADGLRYTSALTIDFHNGNPITIIVTTPRSVVLAPSERIRISSLLGGISASLVAAILAVLVARSLSRPLETLTRSVKSFDGENAIQAPIDAGGEVGALAQSFSKMAADIRERTEQLRAVHEKERLYGAVVESSVDAIMTVTLDGTITAWNPAAEKLFGYTSEEAIGKNTHLITPPDRYAESEEYLKSVQTGERIEHLETVRIDKLGRQIEVAITISPVYDEAGNFICASKIVRDITEFKRISSRLRQAQKMEAIGTLAGGIAHDFNNIIAAIYGNVSMAREDLPEDHPARETLEEIEKAAARATGIVRQILKFSRSDEARKEPMQVGPVIEEAVQFLTRTAPDNIEFDVEIDRDLPAVLASATELHQVVMNLGVNALHAMSAEGGVLSIRVTKLLLDETGAEIYPELKPGSYVRLNLSDSGSGMEASTLERAFEPFFSTKPVGEGTGLGLSTVYGIIKGHNGAITVYSEVGKGTVFRIYLPAATASSGSVQAPEPIAPTILGKGEKILYVDDDEALVTMTKRMLGRLNYNVIGFDSPQDALQAFAADPNSFDVVITDMSMPKMDGPEFVSQIRRIQPDVPVIMLTGYIRPEDTARTTNLGIRRLMLKPNTVQDMSEALREIIDEIRRSDTVD